MRPKVSIIIPVYNGSNFLSQAIDSAINQTYENIEIIVVNDGSNDNGATEKIALSYGNQINYYYKQNGGISTALNYGIEKMTGEYFSWLSHDDLYSKDKIEKQVKSLNAEGDISLCFSTLIDENAIPIKRYQKKYSGYVSSIKLFKLFLNGLNLNGLCFLIPRELFLKQGGFDGNFKYLQDLEMWFRILQCDKKINIIDNNIAYSRVHKNQSTNINKELFFEEQKLLAKKHYDLICDMDNTFQNKNEFIVMYYLLFVKDDNKVGIKYFKKLMCDNKLFTVRIKFSILKYSFFGKIVNMIRNIRYKKLIKKNLRS